MVYSLFKTLSCRRNFCLSGHIMFVFLFFKDCSYPVHNFNIFLTYFFKFFLLVRVTFAWYYDFFFKAVTQLIYDACLVPHTLKGIHKRISENQTEAAMYQNIIRVLSSQHCILCFMPEVQSVKQLAARMCALTHTFKCLTQFIRAFIQLIKQVLCFLR